MALLSIRIESSLRKNGTTLAHLDRNRGIERRRRFSATRHSSNRADIRLQSWSATDVGTSGRKPAIHEVSHVPRIAHSARFPFPDSICN